MDAEGIMTYLEEKSLIWLREGLITRREYRRIVSKKTFKKRLLAIFKLMHRKSSSNPETVSKMFEMMEDLNLEDLSTSNMNSVSLPKHPLEIEVVVKTIMSFLPLVDLKNSRLVSHQWNAIAEPFVREKGTIVFRHGIFHPSTFLNIYQHFLPEVPFSNFKFAPSIKESTWSVAEVNNFFRIWGPNIKKVDFNQITRLNTTKHHNVAQWIRNSPNLETLKIDITYLLESSSSLSIQINNLVLFTFLSFRSISCSYLRNSLQKIRMDGHEIEFDETDHKLRVNTMVVEDDLNMLQTVMLAMTMFKPKVLVLSFLIPAALIDTMAVTRLGVGELNIPNVIIGTNDENLPIVATSLENFMEGKLQYYQFENRRGKPLTKKEFLKWKNM